MAPIRVARLDSVDSTNAELLRRARAGEAAGLVLVAEEQTAGRGRQGRSWLSPPGRGLTFSVLRRPPAPTTEVSRWTWIAALAVHRTVQRLLPAPGAWIKWPNDLLVGDRKVCGLLSEVTFDGDRIGAIVVGIGINVRAPTTGWPPELAGRATSLEEAGAMIGPGSRDRLLGDVVADMVKLEDRLLAEGPARLMHEVRAALAPMVGRRVRVETGGDTTRGTVLGIRDNGALEVLEDSGSVRPLLAGDVHLGTGAVRCFS